MNLYYSADVFETDNRFGICISDTLSCIFKGDKLYFNNFWYAKQVFDLSQYYREATSEDVRAFVTGPKISVENVAVFEQNADVVVRRKIAAINDSKILDNFTQLRLKQKPRKSLIGTLLILSIKKYNFPAIENR